MSEFPLLPAQPLTVVSFPQNSTCQSLFSLLLFSYEAENSCPLPFCFYSSPSFFWLGEVWILLKDAAVLPPSAKIFARMPPVPQSAGMCPILVRKIVDVAIAPGLVIIRAQTGATMGPAFITIMLTRPVIIKTRSAAADTSLIPR